MKRLITNIQQKCSLSLTQHFQWNIILHFWTVNWLIKPINFIPLFFRFHRSQNTGYLSNIVVIGDSLVAATSVKYESDFKKQAKPCRSFKNVYLISNISGVFCELKCNYCSHFVVIMLYAIPEYFCRIENFPFVSMTWLNNACVIWPNAHAFIQLWFETDRFWAWLNETSLIMHHNGAWFPQCDT